MFTEALFTIAKIQNQFRYPPADKWIKKMWHTNIMEYYSVKKKNEILAFAAKWIELSIITLTNKPSTHK